MKIAIHSCFFSSGESATAKTFIATGKNKGYDVREFFNVQEIEAFNPNFVVNFNFVFPKLTRFPTYAAVGIPLEEQRESDQKYLLTFDGYLTVSGNKMRQFTTDLCLSMDKALPVLFFPGQHGSSFSFPLSNLQNAKLMYCGQNWDKRYLALIKLLSKHEWFNVYGPSYGWESVGVNYKGEISYDDHSLFEIYRQAGVGLSLQSKEFVDYNIVTNRILEITAAGAVAIVQKMPFIEENFGDSVLYIDHRKPDKELYKDIVSHMDWIRAHPLEAAEKAQKANQILKSKFSAEEMLDRYLEYHHASMKYGGWSLSIPKKSQPEVAVIIRAGGRPIEILERAFDSLKKQVYQNIRPILVLYKKLDYLEEFLEKYRPFFTKIDVVECWGGIRSTTLWAGLNYVYNQNIPYFCILDDDDEFFPNHISNLFETLQQDNKKGGTSQWAYSLWLEEHQGGEFKYWSIKENRTIRFYAPLAKSIAEESQYLAPTSVFIKTSLLDQTILQDPYMHTGEDGYLWQLLFSKSLPVPSFRLTSLQHQHGENSNFATDPLRSFDLLKLKTRFLGKRQMDGRFWTTNIMIDRAQESGSTSPANRNKVIRILRLIKKIIVRGPSLVKAILLKIEKI